MHLHFLFLFASEHTIILFKGIDDDDDDDDDNDAPILPPRPRHHSPIAVAAIQFQYPLLRVSTAILP